MSPVPCSIRSGVLIVRCSGSFVRQRRDERARCRRRHGQGSRGARPPNESGLPSAREALGQRLRVQRARRVDMSAGDVQAGLGDVDPAQDRRGERGEAARVLERAEQLRLLGDVRGGGEGDGRAERELGRPRVRQRARPTARRDRPASGRRSRMRLPIARVELARGADDVQHAAALGLADQIRVHAGRAEALVVGADHRVAGLQPAVEQRLVVALEVPPAPVRDGAQRVGDAGRAVRPGDDRPAALGRLALGQRDVARDRDRLPGDARRAVQDEAGAGGVRERAARLAPRADEVAVLLARQRARRLVEGGAGGAGGHGSLGGRGGRQREGCDGGGEHEASEHRVNLL